MKVSILHDEHGQIVAVSDIGDLNSSGSKFKQVGMIPAAGQQLLEVELSGDDEKRSFIELHQHYRVDTSAKKLIKK